MGIALSLLDSLRRQQSFKEDGDDISERNGVFRQSRGYIEALCDAYEGTRREVYAIRELWTAFNDDFPPSLGFYIG